MQTTAFAPYVKCSLLLLVCGLLCLCSFCQISLKAKPVAPGESTSHILNTESCTGSLASPLVSVSFGKGNDFGPPLPAGVTNLQYVPNSCPLDGEYTITTHSTNCFNNLWFSITDHTGDTSGYFMLANASYAPSDFFVQRLDNICGGTTYLFSAWILNLIKDQQAIKPNVTFSIEKTDGTVLQSFNSGDIPATSSPVWKNYGAYFTTPPGVTSIVIRLRNNAFGGVGNDLALDDISFRAAGPLANITANGQSSSISICRSTATLSSQVENCYLSNQYQWQTFSNGSWVNIAGANNASYVVPVQSPGKYKYRMLVAQSGNVQTTGCRVNSDTVNVLVLPDVVLKTVRAPLCEGHGYKLPSGRVVNTPGDYEDTVRYNTTCDSLVSIVSLYPSYPPSIRVNKSNDVTCASLRSTLTASGGIKYIWWPGSSLNDSTLADPLASPSTNTMYHVLVTTADGCSAEDSILVNVMTSNSGYKVYMPNAFTPNGDGVNDYFGIKHLAQITRLEFAVYNRWGERVFCTTDPSKCWNGTFKGKKLEAGVFIYQISAMTICGKIAAKGTVALIR